MFKGRIRLSLEIAKTAFSSLLLCLFESVVNSLDYLGPENGYLINHSIGVINI